MLVAAGCGITDSSATRSPDELPARLDNGAKGINITSSPDDVPPSKACGDELEVTGRSLVIRVLPDGPRRPDGSLAFTSGVCVYLPPGYGKSTTLYPVVYLLHGAAEDAGDAVTQGRLRPTMDDLIAASPAAASIVVMPDGSNGQWYDGIDGKIRNETYIAKFVVPYMDRHFRTIAERSGRAITGVSNGGYGAILMAAKHPDLFVAAGGMSSNLDWFGASGLGAPGGPYYRANHPADLVGALVHTDVILDIATRCTSPDPADRCGSQGLDETFLPANRAFVTALEQVPRPNAVLDYHEGDGSHQWRTWTQWLRDRQLPVPPRAAGRSTELSGSDADDQRGGVATRRVTRHGRRLQRRSVAEHVVTLERRPREVADALAVAVGRVHGGAHVGGQRELRRHGLVRAVRRRGEVREHLEVDVGPATGVRRREDAGERHLPVRVGLLHAAEVVLVLDALASTSSTGRPGRSARGRRPRPASAAHPLPLSTTVSSIVSGTPAATPDAEPMLERMSLRTTPSSVRMLGPFVPSPGYGPPVSSGICEQLVTVSAVDDDAAKGRRGRGCSRRRARRRRLRPAAPTSGQDERGAHAAEQAQHLTTRSLGGVEVGHGFLPSLTARIECTRVSARRPRTVSRARKDDGRTVHAVGSRHDD